MTTNHGLTELAAVVPRQPERDGLISAACKEAADDDIHAMADYLALTIAGIGLMSAYRLLAAIGLRLIELERGEN